MFLRSATKVCCARGKVKASGDMAGPLSLPAVRSGVEELEGPCGCPN